MTASSSPSMSGSTVSVSRLWSVCCVRVEITPLPKAPPIVIGVINLGGRIIPVVNIRRRFQLPERELELSDQFIVAMALGRDSHEDGGRLLALAVDAVVGVRDLSTKVTTAAETILPGLEHLEGVAKTSEGLVLIHDLGTFLSLEEESALGALLPEGGRMSVALSPNLLAQLSQFVASRMGLNFPQERWDDLANGMASAAQGQGSRDAEAYVQWLLSSPLTRREIETLASHLTVGETYFFREKSSFDILEEQVLPELIRLHRGDAMRLRIWSAGCCTGEEPYSVAMLLDMMIPDLADWNVTILATDINPRFLEIASAGVYGEWSFRAIPPGIRERYFTPLPGGKMQLAQRIRRMVTFSFLNLAEDVYPSLVNNTNAMDVVLCRNVLMYFTPGACRPCRGKPAWRARGERMAAGRAE